MNNLSKFEIDPVLKAKVGELHHLAKSENELLKYLRVFARAMYRKTETPQCLALWKVLDLVDGMAKSSAQKFNFAKDNYRGDKIEGDGATFTSFSLAKKFDELSGEFKFLDFETIHDAYFAPRADPPPETAPIPEEDVQKMSQGTQTDPMAVSPLVEIMPTVFQTPSSTNDDENEEENQEKVTKMEEEGNGETEEPAENHDHYEEPEHGKQIEQEVHVELGNPEQYEEDYEEDDKKWKPRALMEEMMLELCKGNISKTREELKKNKKRLAESPLSGTANKRSTPLPEKRMKRILRKISRKCSESTSDEESTDETGKNKGSDSG